MKNHIQNDIDIKNWLHEENITNRETKHDKLDNMLREEEKQGYKYDKQNTT